MKQLIQKITALVATMIICATMCLTITPNQNNGYPDDKPEVISQSTDENGNGVCSEECDDDYKKTLQ